MEELLDLGRPGLEPARADLDVGFVIIKPWGARAVIQKSMGSHHFCVASLTATDAPLEGWRNKHMSIHLGRPSPFKAFSDLVTGTQIRLQFNIF